MQTFKIHSYISVLQKIFSTGDAKYVHEVAQVLQLLKNYKFQKRPIDTYLENRAINLIRLTAGGF